MGDMADYLRDQEIGDYGWWPDNGMLEPPAPRVTRASLWKPKQGKPVAVKNLELDHLKNILKMKKEGRLHLPDAWTVVLERELKRRLGRCRA
jgi:hypothetical protein